MELVWKLYPDSRSPQLWELFDGVTMVAWIEQRNNYCDRGHWKGMSDLPGLDSQDMWPNYYMSLGRAKAELEDFTKWRLLKERSPEEMT